MDALYSFLNSTSVQQIMQLSEKVTSQKDACKYNLFSLSSYTAHLENFHSDIIASLLSADGLHGEGNMFMQYFLHYIQHCHAVQLPAGSFITAEVLRERGRIDISLRDNVNRKAILVESKMNHADDQYDQLARYIAYTTGQGYEVVSVLYLSLDRSKIAPRTEDEAIDKKIVTLIAFDDTATDLVTGWLTSCLKACSNDDSRSLLFQYIKLLKHLANHEMDKEKLHTFYTIAATPEGRKTIDELVILQANLPAYRAQLFADAIGNKFAPFTKRYRYKPHYWLYENYYEGTNNYKVDVWFMDSGSANVVFWNPGDDTEAGWSALDNKLHAMGLREAFTRSDGFGYKKTFGGDAASDLKQVDTAIVDFVQLLFHKLIESREK